MAKRKHKYEFRPDPTGNGLANKLYLTQKQRKNALKWLLYGLGCLVALVLQDTLLSRMKIFGGVVDFAPAAIMLVCVLEGAHDGSLFALIASMLYVFSGTGEDTWCIAFMTVYGTFAALIRQQWLRRGFSSDWLCAAGAIVLYEMSVFCMGLFFGLTYPGRIGAFGATALLGALSVPVLYGPMKWIGNIGGETWKE